MIAYLSGAMEQARDEGAGWRAELTQWLRTTLGHDVINPVEETRRLVEQYQAYDYRQWKTVDRPRFVEFVRKLIERDITALTREADYVICRWNADVWKGGGTQGEVTLAYQRGIPVYLVNELTWEELSGWILGCSTAVFSDFAGLKKHLIDVYAGGR
jgi:hypothetical protein